MALANPADPKKSWSHFNVYGREDRSQSWRFEKLQVVAYPTVIVQPPRSGRYGDPKTVVFQGVYGGDPRELAEEIARAIRFYLSKLQAQRQASTEEPQATGADGHPHGSDPPWEPAPKEDPILPLVTPADYPLHIPPDDAYGDPLAKLLGALLKYVVYAGFVSLAGVGAVFVGVYVYRQRRAAAAREQELRQLVAEMQGRLNRRSTTARRKPKIPAATDA